MEQSIVPRVIAVSRDDRHRFSKPPVDSISLLAGIGIAGDAHAGALVQHAHAKAKLPSTPNLRQVHLISCELFPELAEKGFTVRPGELGENVTTSGVDLLTLPLDTVLEFEGGAALRLTGLRTPCVQINRFQRGLMKAVTDRDANGGLIRRAGVMSVVLESGTVSAGDAMVIRLPPQPHAPLPPV